MIQYLKIDDNGFYVEPVFLNDNETVPSNCIMPYAPEQRFYKPKWNGLQWVEGLSQQEIDSINNNQPKPLPTLEELKTNQDLIQKALDDLIFGGAL